MVERDQPVLAIPLVEDGREMVSYAVETENITPTSLPDSVQDALNLAGVWSDLDWDETVEALDRIRHGSRPTPPTSTPPNMAGTSKEEHVRLSPSATQSECHDTLEVKVGIRNGVRNRIAEKPAFGYLAPKFVQELDRPLYGNELCHSDVRRNVRTLQRYISEDGRCMECLTKFPDRVFRRDGVANTGMREEIPQRSIADVERRNGGQGCADFRHLLLAHRGRKRFAQADVCLAACSRDGIAGPTECIDRLHHPWRWEEIERSEPILDLPWFPVVGGIDEQIVKLHTISLQPIEDRSYLWSCNPKRHARA